MSKFDKMKDLEELDSKFGLKNPSELIIDGKKKKKKKKSGDSKGKGLKELTKSELRDRIDRMGIETVGVDLDSKKAMRRAIKSSKEQSKLLRGTLDRNGRTIKADRPQKLEVIRAQPEADDIIPPETPKLKFFYNRAADQFVVNEPIDRTDMECYEAMRTLGNLRRKKRHDDGFAELMENIQKKIERGEMDPDPDVISVPNLAEDTGPKLKLGNGSISARGVQPDKVVTLEPKEVDKLAKDVDAAIAEMRRASQELANNRASNRGKKRNRNEFH